MAGTSLKKSNRETSHKTKRVFLRAERKDPLRITGQDSNTGFIPEKVIVVRRDMTYYGPKLWIECIETGEQFVLTAPGPINEAMIWCKKTSELKPLQEVTLEFRDNLPKYDICPYCNEPLSTIAHRRRSVIGRCEN